MLRKNFKRNCLLAFLCAVLIGCATFSCVTLFNNKNDITADGATIIDGNTYQISGDAQEMAAGWAKAVAASSDTNPIIVKLMNDWTAVDGVFGANNSAFKNGALCVPAGKNIRLNLFGYNLDRGLTEARANGSVIVVDGHLVLHSELYHTVGFEDSRLYCGEITGGNTTGNGGGILVGATGSLTLDMDSHIGGNKAQGNGGGIYINNGGKVRFGAPNRVMGNTVNGKPNNIYLQDGQTIEIADRTLRNGYNPGAIAGITMENGTGTATTGFGLNAENRQLPVRDLFFADDYENYTVLDEIYDDTSTEVVLGDVSEDKNSPKAKKWNEAVMRATHSTEKVTFKLEENWEAEDVTGVYATTIMTSFGSGIGFRSGELALKGLGNIEIDLNGYNIDRRLTGTGGVNTGAVLVALGGNIDIIDSSAPYSGQENYISGKITGGNTSSGNGGGAIFADGGTVKMYSGTLYKNRNGWGGAVQTIRGAFYLYGGLISENISDIGSRGGGGVCTDNQSTFIMYNGEISNNYTNNNGGGVAYFSTSSFFRLYGGKIINNTAANAGGGLFVVANAQVVIEGNADIEISGNKCAPSSAGGGIYFQTGAVVSLSGKLNVSGNVFDGTTTESNIYFQGENVTKPITITGSIAGSHIGISIQQPVTATGFQITSGFGAKTGEDVDVTSIFYADNTDEYKIVSAIGASPEAVLVTKATEGTLVCLPLAISGVIYDRGSDGSDAWQDIIQGYNTTYLLATLKTASTTAGCTIQETSKTIQGKQAGTYVLTFTPQNGAKWADTSTTDARDVIANIGKATYDLTGVYMENKRMGLKSSAVADRKIEIPAAGVAKLSSQGLTLSGYTYKNSSGADIAQTAITAAGDYSVTATITGADTVNYNAIPTISAVLTMADSTPLNEPVFAHNNANNDKVKYSTSARTYTIPAYSSSIVRVLVSDRLSVTGNTITLAANAPAGTYEINFAILNTSEYEWTDGTAEDKTITIIVENYDFGAVTHAGATGLTYNGVAQTLAGTKNATKAELNTAVTWQYRFNTTDAWSNTLPQKTNAGTYTVYYQAVAEGYNSKGGSFTATIAKRDISADDLSLSITEVVFNGKEQKIKPTVTDNSLSGTKTLALSDYEFTYGSDVTNAGTKTITVKAKADGNFTGSKAMSFEIKKKSLTDAVIADISALTYTGADQSPTSAVTIVLVAGETAVTLTAGTHFVWDYATDGADRKNVGDGKTIRIKAIDSSNYEGYQTVTFSIVPATLNITLGGGDATYDGNAKAPTTVVFGSAGANGLLGSDGGTITKDDILNRINYLGSATGYDPEITKVGAYVAKVTWPTTGVYANYTLASACNAVAGYTFNISKRNITVLFNTISKTYDGTGDIDLSVGAGKAAYVSAATPLATKDNGHDSSIYELYISNGDYSNGAVLTVTHGAYTVSVRTLDSNYNITFTASTFTVSPLDLGTTDLVIDTSTIYGAATTVIYDGTPQQPKVLVTHGGLNSASKVLTETTDFVFAYSDNINSTYAATSDAQRASIWVEAVAGGNFTGSCTPKNFDIAQRKITVTINSVNRTYDGTGALDLTVKTGNAASVTSGSLAAKDVGKDDDVYKLSITDSGYTVGDVLTYTHGNYTIELTTLDDNYLITCSARQFRIVRLSLDNATLADGKKLEISSIAALTYDGNAKQPAFTLTHNGLNSANKVLVAGAGKDYTFNYSDNINVSTPTNKAKIVVSAVSGGNFTGSYTFNFDIVAATIQDGDVDVQSAANSWTYDGVAHNVIADGKTPSVSVVAGNAITWQYSLDNSEWKTMVQYTNVPSTGNTYTVYYKLTVENYAVKTGTFTVTVNKRNIATDGDLALTGLSTHIYNGSAQTPTYTLVDNNLASADKSLAAITDYSVYVSDNIDAGQGKLTFTGAGNFTGTKVLEFTIEKKELGVEWTGSAIYTYNKNGQGYTAATNDAASGETVELTVTYTGTDYIGNSYNSSDLPVNAAASYTATVTLDSSYTNYKLASTATLSQTFEIKKKTITAVSGIVAKDKQYAGADATAQLDWSAASFGSDVYSGDELVVTDATGAFSNTGIGGNKRVNISAIEIGSKNGDNVHLNYALRTNYTTYHQGASITKRIITISWEGDIPDPENAGNILVKFNGSAKLPKATAGNLVEGETLTLTVTADGAVAINPGNYKAQAAIASGVYASHYALPEDNKTDFTVYSDNLVVYLDVNGIIYDGAAKMPKFKNGDGAGATEYTMTEGVDYTITYAAKVGSSLTNGKPVNAGEYSATITVSAAYMWWDNEDFTHSKTVDFTIEKADVDVSGVVFEIAEHTYNGALPQIKVDEATMPSAGVERVDYSYFKGSTQITAAEAVNCGTYSVVATFVPDRNHKFANATTSKTATLTVNKAKINLDGVSFANTVDGTLTVTYDGNAHNLALSGTAEGITEVTFTYTRGGQTVTAADVKGCGTYNVTAAFVADGNHEFEGNSFKNGQIVINKAKLTVVANDNVITYGDNPAANGATFNGLVAGETESVLGSLTFNLAYTKYGNAGPYAIGINTFTGAGALNYDIEYKNGTLTVKPIEISITWQRSNTETSTDFVYTQNGSQTFCPYPVITNLVNNDNVTLTVTGATSVAGFGYEAKVTEIKDSTGAISKNYVLPVSGVKVNFDLLPEPKSGKIVWDNSAIYYDGTAQLPKAYYYETDDSTTPVELEVTVVGSTSPVNAGSYTAKVNTALNLEGDKTKNFTILPREVYIVINDMTVNYGTPINLNSVTYDYLEGSLTIPASENYEIKFTSDANGATGVYAIVPSFVCSNTSNYKVTFVGSWTDADENLNGKCGTLTVKKASFSESDLTFVGTEATYDGAPHTVTVLGLPADIGTVITYSKNGWTYADGATNAGTYAVTVNFVYDSSKYNTISPITVNLVIKKAMLEIKANDNTIYYGDEGAAAGYTVKTEGFVGGDSESVLGGAAQYSFGGYTATSNAGNYLISLSGITAENYEISFIPGSLTVKPRVITVTWFDYEGGAQGTHFVYNYGDGTDVYAPFAVAGGAVNGDSVVLTVSGSKSAAGTGYVATAVLANGNYALPDDGTASATFDIIPGANNVVIWKNENLVYGDGKATASYKPEAIYYTDEVQYTASVSIYRDEACTQAAVVGAAGKYYAKATAAGVTLTNDVFEFTVLPREITVIIASPTVKYGAVSGSLSCAYAEGGNEFLPADGTLESLITIVCAANDNSPVGTYMVSGVYAENANYKITIINGVLNIEKALISALPAVAVSDFIYSGQAHEVTVETSGYVGVKNVNISYFDGDGNSVDSVVNVGDYSVKVTFVPDDNYAFAAGVESEVSVMFKVNPAPVFGDVNFAAGNVEFTYNGKPRTPYVTGSATGLKEVNYTYYKLSDGGETEIAADEVKNVGKYKVKATLVFDDKNYTYTGAGTFEKEFEIKPATLTVKAKDKTATYGESVTFNAADAEISGLVEGETLAGIGLAYTVNTSYVAGNPVNNYDIVITVTATAANYTLVTENGTLTVTPKIIMAEDLEWFSNAACNLKDFIYIYDGATAWHPYAKVKSNGLLVGSDTLSFTYSEGKTGVGFGYTVEITATGNTNYTLPVEGIKSCSFDVLKTPPAKFEIIWDYTDNYYDGSAHAPKAFYYDESGVKQQLTVTVDEGNAINVGTYTARVVAGGLNLTGNGVMNFSVEKRRVFIRVGNASAAYGETPNMNGVSWSYEYETDGTTHVLPGDAFTVTFTCEAVSGVGKYKIFAHFSSAKASNYAVEFTGDWTGADGDNGKCGVLTVAKADVNLNGVVYGGAYVTYDGTLHGLSLSGVPAGVTYTLSYSDGIYGYGAAGVINAGTYSVEVTFEIADAEERANYNAIPVQTVTLEIAKAPLAIKANDNTIVYGDEPSANGIDWANAGFKNGETLETSDLQGGVAYVYNYNRYGAAGNYRITPAGLTSNNYEITYAAGMLTVEKRVVTVEWFDDASRSSKTFSYKADGAQHAPYAVAGNLVNGDSVTLTVSGATSETGVAHLAKVTGTDNANYAVPSNGTESVLFDIIPAPDTIVWEMTPFYYNGTAQKPAAYYFDADGVRHTLTVTVDGGEENSVNAGKYTARVTESGLNGDAEYVYEILKLNVSLIIKNATAALGAANPLATEWWTYAAGSDLFVGGDSSLVSCGTLTTDKAGTFDITAIFGGNAANYNFTYEKGTLTVEKAAISAPAFANGSADYDGGVHKHEIATVPAGLTVTYTYAKDGVNYGSNGVREVGVYTVTAHFVADGNHIAPESVSTTFEILALEIDITSCGIEFKNVLDAVYNGYGHKLLTEGSAAGITGVTYAYVDNESGAAVNENNVINVGTYTVTATFAADGNHKFKNGNNTLTATLKINAATLTVKANDVTVIYGDDAKTNGYTISGLAAGDTENSVGLNVTVAINGYTAWTTGVGLISGGVTLTATATSKNYSVAAPVAGNLTVIPREITADEVQWFLNAGEAAPADKLEYTHDGVTAFLPYAKAVINGVTVEFEITGAQKDIGDNYTATITAVSGNANFTIPVGGIKTQFAVMTEKKSGVIIWDNTTLYYNNQNRKPSAYYLLEGDETKHYLEVTVSGSSRVVGAYTASVNPDASLNLTGSKTMTFNVVALPVVIAIGDVHAVYGSAVTFTQDDWSYAGENRFVDGESFTINLTYGGQTDVGKYMISGEFQSANKANYDVTFVGGWQSADANNGKFGILTITKATIDLSSLTVTGTSANYDGNAHNVEVAGLPAGVTAHYEYSLGGFIVAENNVIAAGEYDVIITFTVENANNFNTIPQMTAKLVINKAVITVAAYDNEIVYGEAPAASSQGQAGYIGVSVTGADLSDLSGTLTFTFDYKQFDNAGKYQIVPGGLASDNYTINFVSGVLTVKRRVISVNWFDDDTLGSKTFKYTYISDDVTFLPYAQVGNTVNGDKVTLTVTGAAAKAGLNYVATVTGVDNANYALPADGTVSQTFDIVPQARVVVWDNTQLYYTGLKQRPNAYYFDENGVRQDLEVSVNGDVNGVASVGSGYTAMITNTTGLSGSFSLQFSILPKEITVIVVDKTAEYGKVSSVMFEVKLADGSTLVGTDTLALFTTICTANNSSEVGVYEIKGNYAGSNYHVTFVNGALTVTKAKISVSSITFNGGSLPYDGGAHTFEVSGDIPEGITGVTYAYYFVSGGVETYVGADGVKNAGNYKVVATFTADGNHEFDGGNTLTVNVTVMQSEVSGTVEMNGAEFTYDGTEHKVLASVTAEGVTGVTYAYYAGDYTAAGSTLPAPLAVSGVTNAGTYTVVATFTVAGNYRDIDPIRVLVTVKQATVKVTANDVSKVYGYSFTASDFTYKAEGLIGADTIASLGVNVSPLTVTYTDGDDAGEYVINVTGDSDKGNYKFEYINGKFTVTPYVLSKAEIKWQKSETDGSAPVYDYDGNGHLPYAYAEVNGVKVAEIEVSGTQINAGEGYVALAVKTNSGNYVLPAEIVSTTFTVLPKPVQQFHIIWTDTTVYFDGNPHVPSAYFLTDDGERIDLTVTVEGAAGVINAGTHRAIATLSHPDYTLVNLLGNTEAVFEILPARVFIQIDDISVVYGEAANATLTWSYREGSAKLGAAESGISLGCDVTNASSVGSYKIYGEFDSERYTNYAVTFIGNYVSGGADNGACGVLTVTKATLDLSGVSISGRKVPYNGNLQTLLITNPLADVLEITCAYTLGDYGFGNGGVKNAGKYSVTVSFAIKGEGISENYNAIADVQETFEIEKVNLTLKANDNTVVYGEEPAAAGIDFAAAGFVGGEDEKVLSGTATYGFNYVQYQRVGKYRITVSGLSSANYNVKFEDGELTVAPRTISVSWFSEQGGTKGTEFNYGANGTVHMPYAVAGNVVNNDALTLVVTGGQSAAGTGYIAKVTAITGVGSGNYALPTNGGAQVTFNVLPPAYVVVWEATSFVYNGKAQLPKACYYTEYGGRVELIVTADRYSADAGSYVATATPYPTDRTPITGELTHGYTIAKLDVEVVIENATSEYGDAIAIDNNGWHYGAGGEFVDGNFITLKCSVSAGDNVGVYVGAITCDFKNDNYNITYKNGTYTVTEKILEIPEIAGVDYDGNPHSAEIDPDAPYRIASDASQTTLTDVGTRIIVLVLKDARNYKWRGTDNYDVRVSFSVNKVKNDWVSGYEFAVQGGTVEAGSGKIIFNDYKTLFDSDVTVRYYRDAAHSMEVSEEYVTTLATDGTKIYLVVTVAGTDNFDEIVYETEVTVTGKLKVSLVWSQDPIIYNGTAQAPEAFVWIGSDRILLEVEGAKVNAGTYTATAKKVALDGTDLTGYEFSNPESDFTTTYTIGQRKLTVSIDDSVTVIYGSVRVDRVDFGRLGWSIASGRLGAGDTNESLKITFTGIFGGNEYANVGSYAIVGHCANGNYDVEFLGEWNGDDGYNGKAGVYTVTPATLSVDKNGSEWFDDSTVIESFQSYFVTVGNRTPDDTSYEYIKLKGDQSARVKIRYSNRAFAFEKSSDIPEMTDAQIAQYIIEEQDSAPSISQAGIWVVYYRIEAPNHQVKYGMWRVLILKNTDYIIVTFNPEKQYKVSYGDMVSGRNIIGDLIDGGYVTLSGATTDSELLKLYADAYAYEDVSSGDTVSASTGVNRYTIRFVLNERGLSDSRFNELEFKYKNTNDVNVPDSNIGAFEVVQRELGIKWGNGSFTYDGTEHKPALTLTNLVGGGELEVEYEIGKMKVVNLPNGDVVYLTVTVANGGNLTSVGNYRLLVEIENANYRLSSATNFTDVTIAQRTLEVVWGEREFGYDGQVHLPTLTIDGIEVEYAPENGVCTVAVTLANGDVINVTVTMDGASASAAGSYSLQIAIDNGNYSLSSSGSGMVKITDSGSVGLPVWAIGAIAGGSALALLIIICLGVALKKRKKQIRVTDDEDGFNDEYEG